MVQKAYFILSISILFLCTHRASAGVHTATVTNLVGEVHLLKSPTPQATGDGIHVLFNGSYYLYYLAELGSKVELDEVVQTTAGAKARLLFDNGDQMNVGELTSFKLEIPKKNKTSNPQLDLLFGRIRSVISKEGPRNRLSIKNKTVVMGVRGTDFLVQDYGIGGNGTELQVFRGKVEFKNTDKPNDVKLVAKGDAAFSSTTEKKSEVQVRPITKDDLFETQKNLFVPSNNKGPDVPKEVVELEKKSVDTTLQDMKSESPEAFKKLSGSDISTSQIINAEVLASLFDQAKRRDSNDTSVITKPSREEVEKQIDDVYQNKLKR